MGKTDARNHLIYTKSITLGIASIAIFHQIKCAQGPTSIDQVRDSQILMNYPVTNALQDDTAVEDTSMKAM